jgi:hypothetical protein
MSSFGLIEKNMELSHIYLAVCTAGAMQMVNTFAILTCILRKKETDSRYINLVQMHRFPYGTLVVGIALQKFKLFT